MGGGGVGKILGGGFGSGRAAFSNGLPRAARSVRHCKACAALFYSAVVLRRLAGTDGSGACLALAGAPCTALYDSPGNKNDCDDRHDKND